MILHIRTNGNYSEKAYEVEPGAQVTFGQGVHVWYVQGDTLCIDCPGIEFLDIQTMHSENGLAKNIYVGVASREQIRQRIFEAEQDAPHPDDEECMATHNCDLHKNPSASPLYPRDMTASGRAVENPRMMRANPMLPLDGPHRGHGIPHTETSLCASSPRCYSVSEEDMYATPF